MGELEAIVTQKHIDALYAKMDKILGNMESTLGKMETRLTIASGQGKNIIKANTQKRINGRFA